jgi:DNA-binding CsgD family transcriptional regulator
MPIDGSILAGLFILVALVLIFLWQRRRRPKSQSRTFDVIAPILTQTLESRIIGHDPWDSLTARQQQVARLAARGLSSAEIAIRLDIKTSTVDSHLKNIYATLGVHSRAELSYQIQDYL